MVKVTDSRENADQYPSPPITVPLVLHRVVKDTPGMFEDIDEKTLIAIAHHIASGWVVFGGRVGYRSKLSRNWLLTFDDGHSSDYEIVFPVLQNAGIKAVFFLITDRVGSPGQLSWNQVREMRRYGMEFGSHGATHASMIALDREQALNELTRSRLHIEDHLGEAVTAFSFPYGYYNSNLIKLTATAGYTACCLSDHGTVRLPARVIPRNSINSAMRWPAILKTLEPSPLVHASWIVEDWTKKLVKRVLSDRTYQSLRGAIGKNKNKN